MAEFGLLDPYSRRARLFPVMLVLMPALVAAFSWPTMLSVASIGIALFSWFGLGVLFAELGRDLGKRRELKLWSGWGGSPTVQRLRLRGTTANVTQRNRWRHVVSSLLPDTTLPNLEQETADPAGADETYEVCIGRLRELTRDTSKFGVVFQENVSYGFRRNLWAMKPAAIGVIVIAVAVAIGSAFINGLSGATIASLILSITMLSWWALRITPPWVRDAAERYAERLLLSCEQLMPTGTREAGA